MTGEHDADMRRIGYGAPYDPTPEQYRDMMNAVLKGAYQRAFQEVVRADSAVPAPTLDEHKADEEPALDEGMVMRSILAALEDIEARMSTFEAAQNAGKITND